MHASPRFVVTLALILSFTACQSDSPSSTTLERGIQAQRDAQTNGDSVRQRLLVRQAALDRIKEQYPQAEIQGISIYASGGGGSDYITGVDVKVGAKRATIYVDVQMYVKENGDLYWKASFASPQQQEARPADLAIEEKK